MLAKSEIFELLNRLPEEALAAALILSVIFTFITILVSVISMSESHKAITLSRMSKELIEDLLAKGYTPTEIEPLVNGRGKWRTMKNIFEYVRGKKSDIPERAYRHPTSPVKHTA